MSSQQAVPIQLPLKNKLWLQNENECTIPVWARPMGVQVPCFPLYPPPSPMPTVPLASPHHEWTRRRHERPSPRIQYYHHRVLFARAKHIVKRIGHQVFPQKSVSILKPSPIQRTVPKICLIPATTHKNHHENGHGHPLHSMKHPPTFFNNKLILP